jgi:hypothetical protein
VQKPLSLNCGWEWLFTARFSPLELAKIIGAETEAGLNLTEEITNDELSRSAVLDCGGRVQRRYRFRPHEV